MHSALYAHIVQIGMRVPAHCFLNLTHFEKSFTFSNVQAQAITDRLNEFDATRATIPYVTCLYAMYSY